MPTNTYVALDKVTVGTATATVQFTSIPQGYTDLILVNNSKASTTGTGAAISIQCNSDTGSNYSQTSVQGDGTSAISERYSNTNALDGGRITTSNASNTNWGMGITHFQNYSNTTTNKTILTRSSVSNEAWPVYAAVSMWRNTAAITSLTITCGSNFVSGSTFSLYGIKAQTVPGTAKATGGTITYDDFGRVIHTFTSSGTFTPSETLSCDVLVVGGGGGGDAGVNGVYYGGGGAASIVVEQFNVTATAGAKTVTVGSGGAAGTSSGVPAGSGSNSSLVLGTTITATGGGGGPANNSGGSNATYSGGSGSNLSGGGAGAGGNGGNGTSSIAGAGGSGVLSTILGTRIAGGGNGSGFGTQPGSVDGGGRGGNDQTAYQGAAPTTYGSGGGAAFSPSSLRTGFQGVVVIRYQG